MPRTVTLLLLLLFHGCIYNSETNREIEQFERLLGGKQNRVLLDDFIFNMENKIVSTYKAASLGLPLHSRQ